MRDLVTCATGKQLQATSRPNNSSDLGTDVSVASLSLSELLKAVGRVFDRN